MSAQRAVIWMGMIAVAAIALWQFEARRGVESALRPTPVPTSDLPTTPAASTAPSSASATFSRALAIAAHHPMRRAHRDAQPYGSLPPGPYGEQVDTLRANAGHGDEAAAFALFKVLDHCADVPRLALAQSTSLRNEVHISDEDRARVEASLAQTAQKMEDDCRGIAAEDLAQRLVWLDRAAAGGDDSAQAHYLIGALGVLLVDPGKVVQNAEAIVRVKAEGMRYLEAAVAQGNIDALFQLAMTYRSDRVVPRNPVLSLGYLLAMQQTGLDSSIDKSIAQRRGGMSADDIVRAEAAAQRIYAACCAP